MQSKEISFRNQSSFCKGKEYQCVWHIEKTHNSLISVLFTLCGSCFNFSWWCALFWKHYFWLEVCTISINQMWMIIIIWKYLVYIVIYFTIRSTIVWITLCLKVVYPRINEKKKPGTNHEWQQIHKYEGNRAWIAASQLHIKTFRLRKINHSILANKHNKVKKVFVKFAFIFRSFIIMNTHNYRSF